MFGRLGWKIRRYPGPGGGPPRLGRHQSLRLVILLAVLGCGADDGAADAADVGSPAWEMGPVVWTLAEEPDFSVAEGSGDPPFQLLRAFYGVILEEGTLVVANLGTSQLIFFDSTGTAKRLSGGPGQGPGELGSVSSLFVAEDGVGVYELGSRRLSFFSTEAEYSGSVTLPRTSVLRIAGIAPGEGVVTAVVRSPPGEPRVYQVWNELGEAIRELRGPAEPPEPVMAFRGPSRPPTANAPPNAVIPVEITINRSLDRGCFARPHEAAFGSEVYAVDAGSGIVTAVGRSGAIREVYRAPDQPTVTEALRDTLGSRLARGPSAAPPADTVEAVLGRLAPVGAPLPSWDDVIADPSGRLWLRRAVCPSPPGPRSYDVIDAEGAQLGTVTIPEGLAILAVRGEKVLVVRRDALQVEHLELYRLRF